MEKFLYSFLIAYVSLIPFYYFPAGYLFGLRVPLVKYLPFLLIMGIFLISLLKGIFNLKVIFRKKLNICILAYLILTFFSGFATDYYPVSIFKAVYYGLSGILVCFIVYSWELDINMKIYLLRKIVVVAFLAGIYGIITLILKKDILFGGLMYTDSNLVNPKSFLEIGRISSTFGNPLFLGCFLSAVFPISIYLQLLNYEQGSKFFPKYLPEAISLVIFTGILFTFSVGAFFGIIVFSVLYGIRKYILSGRRSFFQPQMLREENSGECPERKGTSVFVNRGGNYEKRTGVFLFFCASLLFLVLLMLTANILSEFHSKEYLFGKYLHRFDFHKLSNMQAVSLRLDSLKYSFDFLKSGNSLFGIGTGKIGTGSNFFSRVSMDNYFSLLLVENGFLAVSLFLIIFYFIVKKGFRKKEGANFFILSGLIIFFVNMLFWDALNQPTIRILFWSFVGFLV